MNTRDVFEVMRPYMPNWPSTFEQAERDLVAGVILKTMSKRPAALASWLEWKTMLAEHVGRVVVVDPPPPVFNSRKRPRTPSKGIDLKRRAAGERDDD